MDTTLILQYSPYALAMVIVTAITAILALYVWQRRSSQGGLYFSLLMAIASTWTFMSYLEMSFVGLPGKTLCNSLAFASVILIGPLWILFALDFAGHKRWLMPDRSLLFWVIPAITFCLLLTNGWHGLIWPKISLNSVPGSFAIYEHGGWFWVHTAYSYGLILIGSLLLAARAIRSSGKDRFRAATLLLGVIITWLGSLPLVVDFGLLSDISIEPFVFTLTSLLCVWSIFRHDLFDIVSVARATLSNSMEDGVLVLDNRNRIADMNPAAQRLIAAANLQTGRQIEEVFAKWPQLAECCRETGEKSLSEVMSDDGQSPLWLEIRISTLIASPRRKTGRLIIIRDITERKRHEEALKRSNESLIAEMTERKKAEELIMKSLREKEVLLKEIHHRVKNNLQIISSLLNLQSYNQPENSKGFRESQDRIRSMALIHEKLYSSQNLDRIDFSEYVQGLVDYLSSSYILNSGVRIVIDVRDVSLDIDMAIPCGLIINELVSNSLKYAFEGRSTGTVSVTFTRSGSLYTLTVGDDGRGMPAGLDFRESPSLGLQLVNTLVDQLEGKIDLDIAAGTVFTITFEEKVEPGDVA